MTDIKILNQRNQSNVSSRDSALDVARGMALFLVVLSHACIVSYYLTEFYIVAFFLLSGYLSKERNSYWSSIKKKSKRVLLPYFVNSLILLIIYAVLNSFSSDYIITSLLGVLYSRNSIYIGGESIMVSGNAPLWYLTSFFSTSILFHAVIGYYSRSFRKGLCLLAVLISVSIALSSIPILLPWSIDMVPFFTVVMLIGYSLKNKNISLNFNWLATATLLLCYIAVCYDNGPVNLSIRRFWGGQINTLIAGICGSLFCISLCYKKLLLPVRLFFEKIGTNSIVVLSYHILFFGLYRRIISLILSSNEVSIVDSFWCNMLIVIISIITCIIIGRIVEYIKTFKIERDIKRD